MCTPPTAPPCSTRHPHPLHWAAPATPQHLHPTGSTGSPSVPITPQQHPQPRSAPCLPPAAPPGSAALPPRAPCTPAALCAHRTPIGDTTDPIAHAPARASHGHRHPWRHPRLLALLPAPRDRPCRRCSAVHPADSTPIPLPADSTPAVPPTRSTAQPRWGTPEALPQLQRCCTPTAGADIPRRVLCTPRTAPGPVMVSSTDTPGCTAPLRACPPSSP